MSKISIITPTFNRAKLIRRMVNSVVNQSFQDWELIVVDDGSTDNTKEVIAGFKDLRIKYFFKENSGVTGSRNFGVQKSSGKYIIFLDSDDEADPDWLEQMHNKIDGHDSVVSCGFTKIDHLGKRNITEVPKNLGPFYNNAVAIYLCGCILYPKNFFLQVKGYDTNLAFGENSDLFLRLSMIFKENQIIIKNISKALIKIHLHQGDRINHNIEARYLSGIYFREKHKKWFFDNPEEHFNYLSVGGVNAMKIGKINDGKKLFKEALRLRPFVPKAFIRLFISYIPIFRDKMWK